MIWDNFIIYAVSAWLCWAIGAFMAWNESRRKWAVLMTLAGIGIFACFIGKMWWVLERPPMRTMGETRLWYSLFVALIGMIVYIRWRYRWIPVFATLLAGVFVVINLVKPQIHDQALMPALQSVWFVPHVIVYMFSYAMMGCAAGLLLYGCLPAGYSRRGHLLQVADNMAYTGTALLTLGMLFGAIWAKQAWGHYWNWDPKETWAALTWFTYLSYIHVRYRYTEKYRAATLLLVVAFLFLQICWYGINYLPSAVRSIHTYAD